MKLIFAFFKAVASLLGYFICGINWDLHQIIQHKTTLQKILLLGLMLLGVLWLAYFVNIGLAVLAMLLTVDLFFIFISRRLKWLQAVVMIIQFKPQTVCENNLLQSLQALGMETEAINKIIRLATQKEEILLAEWGAEDKLWSYFGKIPAIVKVVEENDFQRRGLLRNAIQLVVFKEKLAVKKCFFSYKRFLNEAFALIKLQNVNNVPRIFKLALFKKTLYRPLIQVENLGGQLEAIGLSVEKQRALDKFEILTAEQFKLALNHPIRLQNIESFNKLAISNLKQNIQTLLRQIHSHNFSYQDIWYANILLKSDLTPYLSDFDLSDWYPLNNNSFRLARICEWKRFNLLFDGDVPVPDEFYALFKLCTDKFSHIRNNRRILFSHGKSLGTGSFFDSANWIWPFIAAKLPQNASTFVHLGIQTGEMAVQALRAGVKECVILENRDNHQACAKLLLNAHQILDNRFYPATFLNQSAFHVSDMAWKNTDVVCSFAGLDGFNQAEITAVLSGIPNTVACVILEGHAAMQAQVLEKTGFIIKTKVKFLFSKRYFTFAYPIPVQ